MRWLSVPPETRSKPRSVSPAASARAFFTICSPYFLKAGVAASRRATAMPAVVWLCGPPWRPGNTARSIALACSSRQRIMPPRGPRSVLWVVVVTTSAWGTGDGWAPAATSPAMWAMSATNTAPTSRAISAKAAKSMMRGMAVPPAQRSFGFSLRARSRTAS